MEKYDIKLYDMKRNSEIEGVVFADEGESSDDIILKTEVESIVITAKSNGYLSAYQIIRDELLKNGFGLKCNGSLINAIQSAMMSYTPKIYLVQIGKQALLKDIVNIWDYCDINCFPDTKEQNQYSEKWWGSLKSKI
ncbi:MAG: hypothetical protein K6G33_10610 [Ruminococcus sp.]|uniref:hypothetical protein n=1 Tax=Ruminococcus sp. TaxID=41978 RepID=UPI0025E4D0CC|nr:hypothetical protein [Ruminococcus sp.]MCR5601176.1 hypothetical protein [Ruminococcus sp.]